jgi:hypothetical protein
MKTLITAIACVVWSCSALGQGTVNFENSDSSLIKQWFVTPTPVAMPPNGGAVQLYWAPAGAAYSPWTPSLSPAAWMLSNPGWTLSVESLTRIGPEPGRFHGGTLTLGVNPGASVDAVVIGWVGSYASFADAYNVTAFTDVTDKFRLQAGTPSGTPGGITGPNQFTGMLFTVPEPSSSCLLLAGVLLLALSRRKAKGESMAKGLSGK